MRDRSLPAAGLALLLLSVCMGVCTPAASAARMHRAPREVKHQITAMEQQWRTATLSGDVALMDRLLSEDYVGISWTGQVNTKAAQLERVRTRSLLLTRINLSDVKIKVRNSVAIVTCRAEIEGTSAGTPMTGIYRYTRVYQRLPGGTWQITNFEATRLPDSGHDHDNSQP